jgi:hypothetical protein
MKLVPMEGLVVGAMLLVQFALQVAAVVAGLVIWDRYLRRR